MSGHESSSSAIPDAIKKFYELKQKYETKRRSVLLAPIMKLKISNSEKHKQLIMSPKPKCISCDRNVGMIFNISSINSEYSKKYSIRCGDTANPCNVNISFIVHSAKPIKEQLHELQKDIQTSKANIIKSKNNSLFGYISKDESVGVFEQESEELIINSQFYNLVLEEYLDSFENVDRVTNLEKMNRNMERLIMSNRANNESVDTVSTQSGRAEIVKTIIHEYVTQIIPTMGALRNLKYDESFTGTELRKGRLLRILTQRPFSLKKYEYNSEQTDGIVNSFTFSSKSPSAPKTLKQGLSKKSGRKTLKRLSFRDASADSTASDDSTASAYSTASDDSTSSTDSAASTDTVSESES